MNIKKITFTKFVSINVDLDLLARNAKQLTLAVFSLFFASTSFAETFGQSGIQGAACTIYEHIKYPAIAFGAILLICGAIAMTPMGGTILSNDNAAKFLLGAFLVIFAREIYAAIDKIAGWDLLTGCAAVTGS
jgi:hypothetical protein